jgi:hypothetical protein
MSSSLWSPDLRVAEKIDADEAYERFPRLRLHFDKNGNKRGNIIVDENGKQNPLDTHDGFEDRIHNYIVGRDPIVLTQPSEIGRGRAETMAILQEVFGKEGRAPHQCDRSLQQTRRK